MIQEVADQDELVNTKFILGSIELVSGVFLGFELFVLIEYVHQLVLNVLWRLVLLVLVEVQANLVKLIDRVPAIDDAVNILVAFTAFFGGMTEEVVVLLIVVSLKSREHTGKSIVRFLTLPLRFLA